jgi:hypothetical protein
LLAVAALVLSWTSHGACYAGPITYTIDNHPSLQGGDTVSGTITTNGTIGNLTTADILSWSFTITAPGGAPLAAASSPPGESFVDGDISATLTSIFFDIPPTQPLKSLLGLIIADPTSPTDPEIDWTWLPANSNPGAPPAYSAADITQLFFDADLTPGAPFEIASVSAPAAVPEPATLTLMIVGLGGLVGVRLARRGRRKGTAYFIEDPGR